MPDRLIRDELLESERWLFLPSDTDRLVFVGLIFRADDFGNLEGGIKRLFRFMQTFTQVKSEEGAATILLHLADADMVRAYEEWGREFYHLPRFRPHRKYLVRKCPPSPWDDRNLQPTKSQRILNRGLAKNLPDTSHTVAMQLSQGVGVGVGVGVGENLKRTSNRAVVDNSQANHTPVDNSIPTSGSAWIEHWTAKGKALGIENRKGETPRQYCDRVIAVVAEQRPRP